MLPNEQLIDNNGNQVALFPLERLYYYTSVVRKFFT